MAPKRLNYQPDEQYPLSCITVLAPCVPDMGDEQPYDWAKEDDATSIPYDWANETEPEAIETSPIEEVLVSVDSFVIDAASRFARRRAFN